MSPPNRNQLMPTKCGQTITLNDDVFEHSETGWWCNAQRGDLAKVTKRTENGWLFVRPLKKPTIGFWVRNSPESKVVRAGGGACGGGPKCSCSYCSGNGHPQAEGCRWPLSAKPATTRAQFDESCRLGPRVIEAASPLQSGCTNVACNLAYEVAENRRLKKQLADALAAKDRAEHACDRLNKKGAELTDAHNELVTWVNEATSLAQACYMVGAEGEVRKLLKFVRKE